MAEEPREDYLPQGKHHFDPGPFTMDLYRLLCLVLADERVASFTTDSYSIAWLQGMYLRTEIRRILISSATALRIWFDLHDPQAFQRLQTDCGKLFPDWPQHQSGHEVLTLRESKEINYDSVIPDAPNNPDEEGIHLLPSLYLYGTKNKQRWRAELSIVDFVKWSAAVCISRCDRRRVRQSAGRIHRIREIIL